MKDNNHNLSEHYFRKVNLNDSYHDHCYLKTQLNLSEDNIKNCPGDIIDGYCSVLSNETGWIYTAGQSIASSNVLMLLSVTGMFLNSLVILALVKTPSLRKEYLTPFIISLAVTDLIFSTFSLPMLAIRFAMR